VIARRSWPAAVLAAVLVLSGCSASDSSIDDATAQTLDDAVVAVAERASVDDFAGALTELEALQAALNAALEAGSVTAERASAVQAEIEVVRSDLAAAIAAVPTPSTEQTQEEEEPVDEAPVEEAPAEESPAPAETEEAPAPVPEETAPVEEESPEEEAPEPEVSEPAEEPPAEESPAEESPGNGNGNGNSNSSPGGTGNGNGNGKS